MVYCLFVRVGVYPRQRKPHCDSTCIVEQVCCTEQNPDPASTSDMFPIPCFVLLSPEVPGIQLRDEYDEDVVCWGQYT